MVNPMVNPLVNPRPTSHLTCTDSEVDACHLGDGATKAVADESRVGARLARDEGLIGNVVEW